jgi:predicted Zn-dependent protease
MAEYEAILKMAPNSPAALNNLAWQCSQAGDARALPLARRAHELAPGNPAIADTLGVLLVAANQAGEGLPLLRQAAAAAPQSAEIAYHLADALRRSGDEAGAQAIAGRFRSASTPPEWRAKFEALARKP